MQEALAFWEVKTLQEMTPTQWESLCDGCAKCCLHKLEDEDSGEVYYTDLACESLSLEACRCKNYDDRLQLVPGCIRINKQNLEEFTWLPSTCAYRRIAEGKPLYDWHHLISGDRDSIHRAGMSVLNRVVPESQVAEDEWEERVIYWVV